MARGTNTFSLGAGFNITGQEPIDSRIVVSALSDLTTEETWNGVGLYNGLVVAVTESSTLYVLKNRDDVTNPESWVVVGGEGSGLVKDVADLKTNLDQKVDKVEGSSLITSEKLALIDTNASDIAGLKSGLSAKLDNTATVNGQAFVEGACTIDATQINIKDKVGANIAGTPVESVLKDLDSRITSAVSGGLTSVTAGNGIEVSGVEGNSQTVSVKKDAKENNMVEISTSGLFVPDMNAY